MNEKEALSEAFAVCHEELERLAGERIWEKLADEPRLVELFQKETRLAEEFDILLERINDLSDDDRDWLMRNLHAEANKAES